MSGYYDAGVHKFYDSSLIDLHAAVAKINNGFEGAVDTFSFGGTLQAKGTKKLAQVSFLHSASGVIPAVIKAHSVVDGVVPTQYRLYQNYPNPFNPTTNIQFDLPQMSIVTLKVYNMLGQEVATLLNNAQLNEGSQTVEFNATNYASGVYFYRLVTTSTVNADGETVGSQFVKVNKMVLVK